MTPDTARLVELHNKAIERFVRELPPKERQGVIDSMLETLEGTARAFNLYIGKTVMEKRLPLDSGGDPDPTKKPQPSPDAVPVPRPPL